MAKATEEKFDADDKLSADDLLSGAKPEDTDVPPERVLQGYNQTYLIRSAAGARATDEFEDGGKSAEDLAEHEVLFRCGNWCYTGHVVLNRGFSLSEIPLVIPLLQRQQSRLHYYCNADRIPAQSSFHQPVSNVYEASEYCARTLASDGILDQMAALASEHRWIEDDAEKTFFEIQADIAGMEGIELVASKTYTRGLIFITIYFEGSFYISISEGAGDQPLLDVKFPNVSHHGEGIKLRTPVETMPAWFLRLTLWHSMPSDLRVLPPPTRDLSSTSYIQMYFVMKSRIENGGMEEPSAYREVLFRFGSWCYGGSIQLKIGSVSIEELPHVIPALRMQQQRLEFVYAADQVLTTSPYAKPMEYIMSHLPFMENEITNAEDVLTALVQRLSARGLADSVSSWIQGDPSQSFFEFQCSPQHGEQATLRGVELCASKCYYASGVVLIIVYFQNSFFVTIADASTEQPLLDSKFPDVSQKGRGYQIQVYPEGSSDWPSLRKVSIWQSKDAMEEEMEERVAKEDQARAAGGDAFATAIGAADEQASKALAEELKDEAMDVAEEKGADEEAKSAGSKAEEKGASSTNAPQFDPRASAQAKNVQQSLGAFHRLKPMKNSGIQERLAQLRSEMSESSSRGAPWDSSGRPRSKEKLFGKPGHL